MMSTPMPTIDAADLRRAPLTMGGAVSSDGPDFAAMMATAGQGLAPPNMATPVVPIGEDAIERGDVPEPQMLADPATPKHSVEAAKGYSKVTPGNHAVDVGLEVVVDPQSGNQCDAIMSQNGTSLAMPVDAALAMPVTPVAAPAQQHPARPASKRENGRPAVATSIDSRSLPSTPLTPLAIEVRSPFVQQKADQPDPAATVAIEQRVPAQLLPVIDKVAIAVSERAPIFGAAIADAVRDVLAMTASSDMRFNVRPETLGRVAVTIERGEAGLGLHLGVETPSAVQAVRQAEPMLNDVRSHAPFVQVSVDLNSSDTRSRSQRGTIVPRRVRQDDREQSLLPAPVIVGRYA